MFLTTWWWAAPAAAGLGIVGYTGLTTGRRRARRLALDAARHEERRAVHRALQAQADTRAAQAQVLAAQAAQRNGVAAPGVPPVGEARRILQQAKQAQRGAALALKASRAHIRAERARIQSISGVDDLPLARLMREHDAVTARWLEYETDLETALAFPQMTDARQPATAAFLRAQQEAMHLRPASATAKMTGAEFAAYRDAIRRVEVAFESAEDAALRASREAAARQHRAAEAAARQPRAAAPPPPRTPVPQQETPVAPTSPRIPDAPGTPEAPRTVWPVPRRDQRR